jgi:hypothetical protein
MFLGLSIKAWALWILISAVVFNVAFIKGWINFKKVDKDEPEKN